MATKEFVQNRLTNAEEKIKKAVALIDKKKKWLDKKQKEAEKVTDDREKYWLECDIENLEDDIKRKQKDLEKNLIPSRDKWLAELTALNSVVRDIKPILDFLKLWKQQVEKYYNAQRSSEERKEAYKAYNEAYNRYSEHRDARYQLLTNNIETWEEFSKKSDNLRKEYQKLKDDYFREYNTVINWEDKASRNGKTFEEVMSADLDIECDAKYDDFCQRIREIAGDILDCSYLSVSPQGNIDGWVKGSKMDAEVHTIPAGGYNIQRFHYRILVYARDKETHKVVR